MIAIHDNRLPEQYIISLKENIPNINFIPFNIENAIEVYDSIAYHPDIYMCKIDNETCIYAPCLAENIFKALQKTRVIKGSKNPKGKYPDTALYNATIIGNTIFHKLNCTDANILDNAYKKGFKTIDIPQGYARCSVIPVKNKGIITADSGIAKIAQENGFDVLKITPGNVTLPGEKYGFLGGATGILPDETVVFIGNIDPHPDSDKIKFFLNQHKTNWINIEGLPLFDCGTIIFF
jgi:N-dimethylarginine dimethylaminohydrolase